MISVHFQGKHSISHNPSLCPITNDEEAEVERFYEDLQDLLELTLKRRCPFHHKGFDLGYI